jgi:hypothetical protein
LELSFFLFNFAPVMLGQASVIKTRNQVSEYPPLSKLVGFLFLQGINKPAYFDSGGCSGTWLRALIAEA